VNIDELYKEISAYLEEVNVDEDGVHLWDNLQRATSILVRLTQIRTELAWEEINGRSAIEAKKFRTMIVDPAIERVGDVARFESRKITARSIEATLDK
jgi:hypothetical protein